MMNIDGLGRIRATTGSKAPRAGGRSGDDFGKLLGDSAGKAAVGRSGSVGIEALLAAQEAGDGLHGRSRGKARAEALLDKLDELRCDMLAGSVPVGRLRAIADLVATQRESVDDPKLAGILDEIDLRAQVELAKLAVAGA